MGPEITDALRMAPARYAAGVDRRDRRLFLSAFTPEGTLWIPPRGDPAGEPRVLRGHDELAQVVERIGRYDRTFHLLGQTLVDNVDEGVAKAETYCIAHHWLAGENGEDDMVLYIRYEDEYRRGDDGSWRITARRLHEDAGETRHVTSGRDEAVAS